MSPCAPSWRRPPARRRRCARIAQPDPAGQADVALLWCCAEQSLRKAISLIIRIIPRSGGSPLKERLSPKAAFSASHGAESATASTNAHRERGRRRGRFWAPCAACGESAGVGARMIGDSYQRLPVTHEQPETMPVWATRTMSARNAHHSFVYRTP